jgi:phosphopantetheine--protein transferase-like protein
MDIRVGTDIVAVSRLRALDSRTKARLFQPGERTGTPERLAGILAAKESCRKALGIRLGWHDIEVRRRRDGRPILSFAPRVDTSGLLSSDLSISHDGGFAIAIAVFAFDHGR